MVSEMALTAHAGRPLFVPPGIQVVRTGPTTRAEFERLLEDEEVEVSGVRQLRRPRVRPEGLLGFVAQIFQLTPGCARRVRCAEPKAGHHA